MKTLTLRSRYSSGRGALPMRLAALAALAMLAGGHAQAALVLEEGWARDPRSNQLLYREQHLVRRESGQLVERLVLYSCMDGTAFARKRVDYRRSAQAPQFVLQDARQGYREGLRRDDAVRLFVREREGAAERSGGLPETASPLVADAGFDEFVRSEWARLQAGKSVPLSFAVPSRLAALGFKVYRVGSTTMAGETAELYRLRLGGLLGWIAPHIDVAYGRESRRLLRFEGLSNLREDDGETQLVARIEFPRAARAATESQWTSLASEGLSACRVRP